jgi:flagellar hook-basal body complex protein FliE
MPLFDSTISPIGSPIAGASPLARGVGEIPLTISDTLTTSATGGPTFENLFMDAVAKNSELKKTAGEASMRFAAGLSDDIHGTMIAAKEAEISTKLVGSIRSKLLDAFHELWRMNV